VISRVCVCLSVCLSVRKLTTTSLIDVDQTHMLITRNATVTFPTYGLIGYKIIIN